MNKLVFKFKFFVVFISSLFFLGVLAGTTVLSKRRISFPLLQLEAY